MAVATTVKGAAGEIVLVPPEGLTVERLEP